MHAYVENKKTKKIYVYLHLLTQIFLSTNLLVFYFQALDHEKGTK